MSVEAKRSIGAMTQSEARPAHAKHRVGTTVISGLFWLLSAIPFELSVRLVGGLIRAVLFFLPRYRRIALRNLEIAYPEQDLKWRSKVYRDSLYAMARLLVDFARMPRLDAEWVQEYVSGDWFDGFKALKRAHPNKGVLIATGHLGSFELLGHCMPMIGHPISLVVRNFKWKALDDWWKESRERFGNTVISRKGAFKDVIEALQAGRDVALLFDQNVTAKHATFVPWFGKEAATTKTLAIAILRCECPVVMPCMLNLPDGRYRALHYCFEFKEIISDSKLTSEQKINLITRELSAQYERFIRMQPESWFWLHRRWRTRPTHDPKNPYEGC